MAKIKAVRTHNAGTMTKSGFFNWLRQQVLRKKSMHWKPMQLVKNNAKVPYVGPNNRRKFSYLCGKCNNEFSGTEVAVHHIKPCGELNSFDDLPKFVENLFCEVEGLILLCDKCHSDIHSNTRT